MVHSVFERAQYRKSHAGMLQITIVLLSVSIIASMNVLFLDGALLDCLGLLATLNGFLLVI